MVSKLTTAVIVIVVVAVVGVGGYEGYLHSKAPASGNTLIIASSATPASIDPAVAFDTNSVFFDDQIYQTLLGYGTTTFNGQTVGSLTPVPELATNWTVYSNGSVLFNLRQNVTFSNGDPFNASDVQFSLDRVITMSQGASFHVAQFLNASGIHVLGPYKIMLVPSAPYPWFLNLFQLWVTGIVDPNYVNAHGGVVKDTVNQYMSDHAMGTGPYMLQNYTSSQITLVVNPHYWGPKPNVQKIVYEIVPSPTTQQSLLEKGSVNVALNIPLDQMSTLKNYTNINIEAGPTSSEYYIGLDENVSPFNNLDVRLAIEYAVNRTQLTQYSTFGYGLPIQSAMAPTIEGYIPAFKNYTLNLSEARHYLNLSPYPKGFTTSFYYTSGDPIGSAIATILQSELKQINITLNLNAVESATFNDEVGLGKWPMFYEGWVNLLATPDDGLRPLFSAHNLGIYGNYNYFDNTTVTNDLVNAGKLYNISQRDALYEQVQKILAQQAVEVPLFNLENVIPVTSNVHDLYVYPTFDIYVWQITMS
ncbi:ABC transporter substrate-binding protein [Thermoplasmatales archaeon AK]|nr:ABC transporter substrate-binding protein [Thermoplasmatales archaeon AK]